MEGSGNSRMEVIFQHVTGGNKENHEPQDSWFPAEIRTESFLNISLEYYRSRLTDAVSTFSLFCCSEYHDRYGLNFDIRYATSGQLNVVEALQPLHICNKLQCGRILCESETVRYKNINKVSLYAQNLK
jgi:hypothetical protein